MRIEKITIKMNYADLLKESIDEGVIINKNSEEYEYICGIIEEAGKINKIIKNLSSNQTIE